MELTEEASAAHGVSKKSRDVVDYFVVALDREGIGY
jgi:hypothetical protein